MVRRLIVMLVGLVLMSAALVAPGPTGGRASADTLPSGPLHTGIDGVIYDAANQPVRLVGFNWTGTENGGRSDFLKEADGCGASWRIPSDGISDLPFDFDNMYQVIRDWGYNVIRLPVSWHNLEPVAPVWDAGSSSYQHSWNGAYLDDLKSMVSKARAAGLMVILDMHQDYWSPALHNITNWDGSRGYCEGVGMPRWLYPTMDAKASTLQDVDFYNGMSWFYRNIHDPLATVTHATPWQLLYSAWDFLAHEFSAASGFADHLAVVGADLLNEPYFSYVGGSPPVGQTVLQAAGTRLLALYDAIAPSVTTHNPGWLLLFQDCTGGYNAANPSNRETPTLTAKPSAPGNWVYSLHFYDFAYGTFSDGVLRHDDFGITLADVVLARAQACYVPLLIGEFTNFTLGVDARQLTDSDMEQTLLFLDWAREHGVSWTFWAYVNPYRPMTVVDYTTNQAIPVVQRALDGGLDPPSPPNQAPVASFTNACDLLACTFDGSESSDSDGSVVAHRWTFGDGSAPGSGVSTGHSYPAAGTFTVTLTVTDDDGATGSVSHTVVAVAPPPPPPPTPTPGEPSAVTPLPLPTALTPELTDSDGDGVPDSTDACPTVAGWTADGGCPPLRSAVVTIRAKYTKSRLYVNVNPNKGKGYWTLQVQRKKANGAWKPLKTYRTEGSKETRTINLGKGTYRVVVRAKYGYLGTVSAEVHLKK